MFTSQKKTDEKYSEPQLKPNEEKVSNQENDQNLGILEAHMRDWTSYVNKFIANVFENCWIFENFSQKEQ